jgi:hypothetical protein
MELGRLAQSLRHYEGVRKKHMVSQVCSVLPIPPKNVLAHFGEDCAVLEHSDDLVLLLACDGIMESLIRRNPWWAGYCSVLVNVNDIFAMGGKPVAMVNVVSASNRKILTIIARGMGAAVRKFGVPMVGGHTHPDAGSSSVSVSILGTARKGEVLYSHTAGTGDSVVMACDLDGRFTRGVSYSWDTTSHKSPEEARKRLGAMQTVAKKRLATAAKDISMPGTLGTLGMLLESSGKGAIVDIGKIPTPPGFPADARIIRWLRAYQGCGFVLTCRKGREAGLVGEFEVAGITAAVVGRVTGDRKLIIREGGDSATVFDFSKDYIAGIH